MCLLLYKVILTFDTDINEDTLKIKIYKGDTQYVFTIKNGLIGALCIK